MATDSPLLHIEPMTYEETEATLTAINAIVYSAPSKPSGDLVSAAAKLGNALNHPEQKHCDGSGEGAEAQKRHEDLKHSASKSFRRCPDEGCQLNAAQIPDCQPEQEHRWKPGDQNDIDRAEELIAEGKIPPCLPEQKRLEQGDIVQLSQSFGNARGEISGPFHHSHFPVRLLHDLEHGDKQYRQGDVLNVGPFAMTLLEPEQEGEEGWPELWLSRSNPAADPESYEPWHKDNRPGDQEATESRRYLPASPQPPERSEDDLLPDMLEAWASSIQRGVVLEDTNSQLAAEDIRKAADRLRALPSDSQEGETDA